MIRLLPNLPSDVVGFEAIGEVRASDYESVLAPAITEAIAASGDINVLYVLGDAFTGYSGGALWEDAVVGTEHFAHWKKIAVVTDTPWVEHTVNAFAWMMPTRIRVFSVADRPAAESWVSTA